MKNKWLYWCGLITLIFLCLPITAWAADNPVGVSYRGHIQDLGDYPRDGSWVDSPEIIGTVGQSKRIEGFEIKLSGTVPEGMELRYNVHVQNMGWLYNEDDPANWPKDGAYAGTRGDSLRIEAVKIVLTDRDGKAVPGYSVQYRGHVQNVGDLPADKTQWLADGAQLGTVGSSLRLEALLVQVVKTGTDPVEPTAPQVYDRAGTYGPDQDNETIADDVTIAADGVILQNLTIAGNLTISETVGDGNVTLNNVTVKGDTFVRGGGVNSIKINGGKYSRIVLEKTASGAVRIVALNVDGIPFVVSEAAAGETIILEGAFESVTVNAPNMTVTTQGATTIGTMTVSAGAAGSTVTVAAGTTVSDLVLDSKAAVKGQGNVAKAEVKADGVVFDKKPGTYSVEPGVVIPPVFPTDSGGSGSTTISVSGVSLNKTALTLSFNTSETLVATVAPANASNQAVTWTSSDDTIATVDATGKVTGNVKEGSATITVTTVDGVKSASCTVTVTSFKLKIAADGTGIITGRNGSSTDIAIPETIGGLTITAIGDNAFEGSVIEKVTIPKMVKVIGDNAFKGCENLKTVSFAPDSTLETIGSYAFINCFELDTFSIPQGVTTISERAFYWCSKLTSLTLPASLKTLGEEVFGVAGVLDEHTWQSTLVLTFEGNAPVLLKPAGLLMSPGTTIKYYENYSDFTTGAWVGFPHAIILTKPVPNTPTVTNTGTPMVELSWTSIPGATGYQVDVSENSDLSAATSVTVSEAKAIINTGLTAGKSYYFAVKAHDKYGESLLSDVKLVAVPYPNPVGSVTLDKTSLSLGVSENAQLNATIAPADATNPDVSWTSTDDSIATVGTDGTVNGLKEGLATITVSTQDGNKTATCEVTVKDLKKDIGGVTVPFAGETPVKTIATTSQYSGTVSWQKKVGSGLTALPEGETFDGTNTYQATITLTIKKPYTAADISKNFFKVAGATATNDANTRMITAVFVPTHQYKITNDGMITGYSGPGGIISVPAMVNHTAVTRVGNEVFKNQTAITEITLPATVTSIETAAFSGCTGLTAVIFTAPTVLKSIGEEAFSGCTALAGIAIPQSVTAIKTSAFEGCTSLSAVTFAAAADLKTIDDMAFHNCKLLQSIAIPDQVTAIGGTAFLRCEKLNSVTFTANSALESIGANAFNNCWALTEITIPAKVTSLGVAAFSFCTALQKITILGHLTAIEDQTFLNCQALEAISIPASVTKIGEVAFQGCQKLTAISFQGAAPSLGADAIEAVTKIKYYVKYTGFATADWASYPKEVILAKPVLHTLTIVNDGNPQVTVSWNPVDNATAYDVFVSNTAGTYGGAYQTVAGNVNTVDITGLDSSKSYYFVIKARDAYGESLLSDEMKADLNIPVTSVSVNPAAVAVNCGATTTLTAVLEPANAANKAVTWSSSNTAVATVGTDGTVTAVSEGLATIKAITTDGGIEATCAVTVKALLPDIAGVGVPYYGGTPATTITETDQYTGSIVWKVKDGADLATGASFGGSTTYVATINLSLKDAYSAANISADFFKVAGATAINGAGSVSITAEFPATGPFRIDAATGMITAYSGTGGVVSIPDQVNGVTVTGIGAEVFKSNQSLTEISIPETVTIIKVSAFHYCRNLSSVTFRGASQLKTLETDAFSTCKLSAINLPTGLETIGDYTFYNNLLTVTLTIPANVTSIGCNAFERDDGAGGTSLSTLVINSTAPLSIGNSAFKNHALTSITIPTNVGFDADAVTMGNNGSGFYNSYKTVTAGAAGIYTYNTTNSSWSKQ
ncbi:leucine-rich repeat protein [Acetobacterium paludosum]|uniref:Leucine-rich repeat protein n=1 Tax=Acetobacterium paludosum TaxID=52693 RepID=A0A923HV75_9FIRM|nr:leucine-rich repeat protein [Acetobacterium paludosum]MBC3887860.1 leucine-rich repeat protein [Acetobacterium paludosum]